ncbi:MAG: hypothetical protein VB144_00325 [Clostridia bacterium]|nr:hypothetical protein [Clostridia bacterium]
MHVSEIRGVLVAVVVMDDRDVGAVGGMDDSQMVAAARRALGEVVPENLIRDILVGREGSSLHVAFSL